MTTTIVCFKNMTMKNKVFCMTLFTFCLLNLINKANGQTKTKLNTVYFELGGNGLFTSINYERQLLKSTSLDFHIGTGIYGVTPTYLNYDDRRF